VVGGFIETEAAPSLGVQVDSTHMVNETAGRAMAYFGKGPVLDP